MSLLGKLGVRTAGANIPPELRNRNRSRGPHAVLALRVGIGGRHWLYLHLLEGGMGSSSRPTPVTLGWGGSELWP